MTILTRYLLRSYLPSFLLCLGVFLFVLLMNYFLRLFNLAVMKGISRFISGNLTMRPWNFR